MASQRKRLLGVLYLVDESVVAGTCPFLWDSSTTSDVQISSAPIHCLHCCVSEVKNPKKKKHTRYCSVVRISARAELFLFSIDRITEESSNCKIFIVWVSLHWKWFIDVWVICNHLSVNSLSDSLTLTSLLLVPNRLIFIPFSVTEWFH